MSLSLNTKTINIFCNLMKLNFSKQRQTGFHTKIFVLCLLMKAGAIRKFLILEQNPTFGFFLKIH